jgi:alkanesulfonate monooxygenase SsuD/methylene tetrahydromethanopterin reductase-like flavin-dependent oxidoreductase (luciferase family)
VDLAIYVRNLPAIQLADVGRFAEDHGYTEVFVPDGARGGMTDANGRLNGRDAIATLAAMYGSTSTVRGTLVAPVTPVVTTTRRSRTIGADL